MKALIKNLRFKPILFIVAFFATGIDFTYAKSVPDGPDCINPPCYDLSFLAPSTPAEADFNEDVVLLTDISILAPVTPPEAEFDEEDESFLMNYSILAPVTPLEAGFDEEK